MQEHTISLILPWSSITPSSEHLYILNTGTIELIQKLGLMYSASIYDNLIITVRYLFYLAQNQQGYSV